MSSSRSSKRDPLEMLLRPETRFGGDCRFPHDTNERMVQEAADALATRKEVSALGLAALARAVGEDVSASSNRRLFHALCRLSRRAGCLYVCLSTYHLNWQIAEEALNVLSTVSPALAVARAKETIEANGRSLSMQAAREALHECSGHAPSPAFDELKGQLAALAGVFSSNPGEAISACELAAASGGLLAKYPELKAMILGYLSLASAPEIQEMITRCFPELPRALAIEAGSQDNPD